MNFAQVADSGEWLASATLAAALSTRWRAPPPSRTPLRTTEFPATLLVPTYKAVAHVLRARSYARDPGKAAEHAPYFADLGCNSGRDSSSEAPAPLQQMLFLDGDAHDRAKRPIAAAFGQAQRHFPALLSRISEDVLDELAEQPKIDVVRDFAGKISLRTISTIIGIEPTNEMRIRTLAEDVFGFFINSTSPESVDRGRRAFDELVSIMVAHAAVARCAATEERGIFAQFLRKDDALSLSAEEWGIQLAGLFVAGSLTTADLIASACLALLAFPDLKDAILIDSSLIYGLIEEVLRLEPPSTFSYRIATEHGSLSGCPYDKGEILYTSISSANRDALVFTRPDQIDLAREALHLTFGGGAHFCPGAPLARTEAAIAIQSLFGRYPNLTYASPRLPEWSDLSSSLRASHTPGRKGFARMKHQSTPVSVTGAEHDKRPVLSPLFHEASRDPSHLLVVMTAGHVIAKCVHAAVEARLAGALAAGARTIAELAAATNSREEVLRRLLAVLGDLGLVTIRRHDNSIVYELGALGGLLSEDGPLLSRLLHSRLRRQAIFHVRASVIVAAGRAANVDQRERSSLLRMARSRAGRKAGFRRRHAGTQ